MFVQCPASRTREAELRSTLFSVEKVWGGRRGLNPRHSVPQTDALPAELLPPLTDDKQFTLLFHCGKVGSMGPKRQFYSASSGAKWAQTQTDYVAAGTSCCVNMRTLGNATSLFEVGGQWRWRRDLDRMAQRWRGRELRSVRDYRYGDLRVGDNVFELVSNQCSQFEC